MNSTNSNNKTYSGALLPGEVGLQEAAAGGRRSPQKSTSKSQNATQRVVVLRQAATASNGAGRATVGGSTEQAPSGGEEAAKLTARNHVELIRQRKPSSSIKEMFRGWWAKIVVTTLNMVVKMLVLVLSMSTGDQSEKMKEFIKKLTYRLNDSTDDLFVKTIIVTVFAKFVLDKMSTALRNDYTRDLLDSKPVKNIQGCLELPEPVVNDGSLTNDVTKTRDGIITNDDSVLSPPKTVFKEVKKNIRKQRSPTVRDQDVKLYSSNKTVSRKNASAEMAEHLATVDRYLNRPSEEKSIDKLIKYWMMRHRLFSRFPSGILLDEESFYSVCPESLSRHIAHRCHCEKIVDPFCGAGGNVVQFTRTCTRVIGIDFDGNKIKLAKNNAKVYGVENQIEFRVGDYFTAGEKDLKADVVYMSPPWGGPEYINRPVYSLATMCAERGGGKRVIQIAREIAPKIAIHLPRNLDKNECVALAKFFNFEYILFENNYINNKLNSTTLFLK